MREDPATLERLGRTGMRPVEVSMTTPFDQIDIRLKTLLRTSMTKDWLSPAEYVHLVISVG